MKCRVLPFLILAAGLPCLGGDIALYEQGMRAIQEGIPEVAIEKFQRFLGSAPDADAAEQATLRLAEAMLESRRSEEAVAALSNRSGEQADFLRAQGFLALGRADEARQSFQRVPTQAARMGEAVALIQLGRSPEALKLLESIHNRETPVSLKLAELYMDLGVFEKSQTLLGELQELSAADSLRRDYLQARSQLGMGECAAAQATFERILRNNEVLPDRLRAGAVLGLAEASIRQNQEPESVDVVLEEFISRFPSSQYLLPVFEMLDAVYSQEQNPPEATFKKWIAEKQGDRAALAHFFFAKARDREQKADKALDLLEEFQKGWPEHPLAARGLLFQGKILLARGEIPDAVTKIEAAMRQARDAWEIAECEMLIGHAYFGQREFVLAATAFQRASAHPPCWESAIFNSALSWLYQGNHGKFLEEFRRLSARHPDSDDRLELALEEGLFQARSGDDSAVRTLERFEKAFSDHPRAGQARMALAELALMETPPNSERASKYIKASLETPQGDAEAERAAYLAIYLADVPGQRNETKAITDCLRFIRERPESVLLPEVRMKLAQIYFRRQDYANAQTQFETLAQEASDSPLCEAALFLAGEASMRSMNERGVDRAVELFEEVAKLNGPMKLQARSRQAAAKTRLGRHEEAIMLYENILRSQPDSELRFGALAGKGDGLLVLGAKDSKALEQAIEVFQQLASEQAVPPQWRNQALYKKGKALQALNRSAEGLAAFYDALDAPHPSGQEYFWFYKAGFEAARFLESQQQWKSALGIYRKMSAVEGPRAAEAKSRIAELQLEHFIWEE